MPLTPWIRRFRADARGNFAVSFALVAPLMIAGVGFGLVNWLALSEKSRLDGAADAAAIAAAKAGTDFMNAHANDANGRDLTQKALAAARAAGQGAFAVNAGPAAKSLSAPPQVEVSFDHAQFTANVTYNGAFNTAFAGMFGMEKLALNKTATAVNGAPGFLDLVLVIDNSESMGIGATPADQQVMQTTVGCTVACHLPGGDTETALRNSGVAYNARIDIIRQSLINQLNRLEATTYPGQVRLSIYVFSHNLTQFLGPTTDFSIALAAVRNLDLGADFDTGGTYTTKGLEQLAAQLPHPGDGSAPDQRAGAVLLFSDGVQDSQYATPTCFAAQCFWPNLPPDYVPGPYGTDDWWAGALQPIDGRTCAGVKSLGYAMYALDFEYLIDKSTLGTDGRAQYISKILPIIQSEMSACASSPAYFAVASTPVQFQSAMNRLMQQATSTLRLTQ